MVKIDLDLNKSKKYSLPKSNSKGSRLVPLKPQPKQQLSKIDKLLTSDDKMLEGMSNIDSIRYVMNMDTNVNSRVSIREKNMVSTSKNSFAAYKSSNQERPANATPTETTF